MVDMPNSLGGGKFKPYVKAIIEAERAPIRQIEARKAKDAEKLKLLQEFTGRMRKLGDVLKEVDNFKKFRDLKADFGKNDDLMSVEVDKTLAEPGEYQVEIVQLAGRHSMISNGFESADTEIGVGFFSYQTASGDTKSVYLDSDSNTLRSLVNRINSEKDLNLQAMVVNDGSGEENPWRVIVSGKSTGMDQDITYPDFYFVDGDVQFSAENEREAQSAIVKLNGFEIMTPTNKLTELIPGLNIELKQAKEGQEITLTVSEDVGKVSGKIKGLVENINGVLEFINKQNQLDEKSDTTKSLGGDGMLRNIESQLRQLILTPFVVSPENAETEVGLRASDLGIAFERTGQLSFNGEKFQKKLTQDFDQVAGFFTGSGNLIERLKEMNDNLTNSANGLLPMRERGFRDRTRQMDEQIVQKEQQITRKEEGLKQKFANLEATMQNMQSQQAYMAQALGGGGGGGGG